MSELNALLNSDSSQVSSNVEAINKFADIDNPVLRLQSLLNYIIDNGVKGKPETLKVINQFNIKISYSSIQSKIKIYKAGGVGALSRKEKTDKGTVKSFSNEVLQKLQDIYVDEIKGGVVKRAYEDTHKHFRSISREFINSDTGEVFTINNGYLCDSNNHQILSYYTTLFIPGVYRLKPEAITGGECELEIGSYGAAARFLKIVKKQYGDAIFMARFGVHDYRNRRQHAQKIDYSKLKPTELICGDGKLVDILVISDDWRHVYRPWLMGWMDMQNRRFCYQESLSETSEAIANSLAVAVSKWGLPERCLHDNGKSYLSGRFHQMKEHLGIKTRKGTIKLARVKPIESFWHTLDNLLKTQIGYTGNKREEFPQDTRDRLKFILGEQRDLKRIEKMFKEEKPADGNIVNISNPEARMKNSKKRLMHISEFIELLENKLEEYHETVHRGLMKDAIGKQSLNINCTDEVIKSFGDRINTPMGRYDYKVQLGFTPARANPDTVSIYAMNYDTRICQLKTGIAFNNEEYYSAKLRQYAGERVLIRYTHSKTDALYVFYSEELQKIGTDKKYITSEVMNNLKFICIAERQRAIHYNDESFKESIMLRNAEERKLRNSIAAKPEGNIHSISALDSQIKTINDAEQDFVISNLNKEKPFKKYKDLFDD